MNVDIPIASPTRLPRAGRLAGLHVPAWPVTLWAGLAMLAVWSLFTALAPLLVGRS